MFSFTNIDIEKSLSSLCPPPVLSPFHLHTITKLSIRSSICPFQRQSFISIYLSAYFHLALYLTLTLFLSLSLSHTSTHTHTHTYTLSLCLSPALSRSFSYLSLFPCHSVSLYLSASLMCLCLVLSVYFSLSASLCNPGSVHLCLALSGSL